MPIRTPWGMLRQALAWHRVVMQAQDTPVPDTMPIRTGGRMAAKQSTSKKIIEESMREVFDNPPSTVKPGQSAEATRKQKVAIGLSKAREKGAKVPKKSSKASY